MNTFEKILQTMSKNLGYTILFVAGIIIFLYSSDADIIGGLLTAGSALVVYITSVLLYNEYKRTPASATRSAPKPAASKPAAAKKSAPKKKAVKKTAKKK